MDAAANAYRKNRDRDSHDCQLIAVISGPAFVFRDIFAGKYKRFRRFLGLGSDRRLVCPGKPS